MVDLTSPDGRLGQAVAFPNFHATIVGRCDSDLHTMQLLPTRRQVCDGDWWFMDRELLPQTDRMQ